MIEIAGLTVRFGRQEVVTGLDLTVGTGEFVTLLGSSGCGKSTLLRAIAGFGPVASGSVKIDGKDITRLAPEDRGIGFVFQSYALFPHMSVAKNIGFGPRLRALDKAAARAKVNEVIELTGLAEHAEKMPAQLSGGQQQRVAIARVLVTDPAVVLMDEPLSNLDATLRVTLRQEISRLHRDLGMTIVYVTHDQEEALALSDRVAVMRNGAFEQVATPATLYHRPATSYVCQFVGSANEITEKLAQAFGLLPSSEHRYVRPERLLIGAAAETAEFRAKATITDRVFLGALTQYRLVLAGQELGAVTTTRRMDRSRVGDSVLCGFAAEDIVELGA